MAQVLLILKKDAFSDELVGKNNDDITCYSFQELLLKIVHAIKPTRELPHGSKRSN